MPKAPKTLLDEARQVLNAYSGAYDRMMRRNRNIEDLYRRFQNESGYDYPMYELQQDYKWLDERDAAMDAYVQSRRLVDNLERRRFEVEDAIRRMEYKKAAKQEYLNRLIREQDEWRYDDETKLRNPRFYEAKGRYYDYEIPKVREAVENFEIPPAGWRSY